MLPRGSGWAHGLSTRLFMPIIQCGVDAQGAEIILLTNHFHSSVEMYHTDMRQHHHYLEDMIEWLIA